MEVYYSRTSESAQYPAEKPTETSQPAPTEAAEEVEMPETSTEVNRDRSLLVESEGDDDTTEKEESIKEENTRKGAAVVLSSLKEKSQAFKESFRSPKRGKKNTPTKISIIHPDGSEEKQQMTRKILMLVQIQRETLFLLTIGYTRAMFFFTFEKSYLSVFVSVELFPFLSLAIQ